VSVPGSKSHTIRAVVIASLAEGESRIEEPLESADTLSAVSTYRALGAEIELSRGFWRVKGTGARPRVPADVINVGNSGTTLRIALGSAALLEEGLAVFTGDEQIRRRPCGALAASLNDLGGSARSARGNGLAPFVVGGRLRGGKTSIEATTSQFLTSLLLCTPLADGTSEILVPVLNEKPYVEMTLEWLSGQGIEIEREGFERFVIRGKQNFRPVRRRIPADFSSATFFLVAGALGENDVLVRGLDMDDTQGDKAVIEYLRQMGARVEVSERGIRVSAGGLRASRLDLNATPDALPMLAVAACFAEGETILANVPQARLKETDRISVMREELSRLGAKVRELEDGLVIEESALHGAHLDARGDHRVVMALAVAGCSIPGETIIEGAEALDVTFPQFVGTLRSLGAEVEIVN